MGLSNGTTNNMLGVLKVNQISLSIEVFLLLKEEEDFLVREAIGRMPNKGYQILASLY